MVDVKVFAKRIETLDQQEEELHSVINTTRGNRRAAITRRKARKQLAKVRREETEVVQSLKEEKECPKNIPVEVLLGFGAELDELEEQVLDPNANPVVLAELWLEPDPAHFLPSPQSKYWKRQNASKAYHKKRLLDPDCPLSSRISAWEAFDEQPTLLKQSTTLANAWQFTGQPAVDSATHGDPLRFRDLDVLAGQMDFYGKQETCFKLCSIKPPADCPEHADCIVLYKANPISRRVGGAVIYDAEGKARVDVNYQHHNREEGRFTILSGHWHLLEPGKHTHDPMHDGLHCDWKQCPWLWQAIPVQFGVVPLVPIGE